METAAEEPSKAAAAKEPAGRAGKPSVDVAALPTLDPPSFCPFFGVFWGFFLPFFRVWWYGAVPNLETFGFSEMSAVVRFGTTEIRVRARFRVRTFFRCAQVKNFFELECPVCMFVVQPQDLPNWHAKVSEKYPLP